LFPKSSLIVVDALARASKTLIQELETRFPTCGIMDAFGIIYPQYWLYLDCEAFSQNTLT